MVIEPYLQPFEEPSSLVSVASFVLHMNNLFPPYRFFRVTFPSDLDSLSSHTQLNFRVLSFHRKGIPCKELVIDLICPLVLTLEHINP